MPEDEGRNRLAANLTESDFNQAISRIRALRHNYIAHLNYEFNVNPDPQALNQIAVELCDLKKLRDELVTFFRLLCLGHQYIIAPPEYRDSGIWQSDIEEVMDCLAGKSLVLHMPKNDPDRWSSYRENLSQEELDMLNEWRRKCGLSEA